MPAWALSGMAEVDGIQSPASGPRALVVEDERDMNALIAYHLQKNGISTVSALDGESGLALALKGPFDVIILDLMLPSMSGVEICRRLMAGQTPPPPIILLTAVSPSILEVLREELRAAEIMHKPFKPQDLVRSVLNALHLPPPGMGQSSAAAA